MQTYQHSLKWITEDLNKNEELILEIMPLCPFCLTTNKARIMLFNKTPTKNTISGLLQNLINLQITAEDAKLFLKKHKLLKNTTPNQINKLAFTPIIDSLYDINGIVYPNNIINFINLEKNLVQRPDAAHLRGCSTFSTNFLGCQDIIVNNETYNGIANELPNFYKTIVYREYGIADSPYYIKIACTKNLKEKIISMLGKDAWKNNTAKG